MRRWSLRTKLIVAFLGVAVLPLMLLGWWMERTAHHGIHVGFTSLAEVTREAVGELARGLSEVSQQTVVQVGRRAETLGTGGVSDVSADLTSLSSMLMQDTSEEILAVAETALGRQASAALVERGRWMARQVEQFVRLHLVALKVTGQRLGSGAGGSEAEAALRELLASQPAFLGLALLDSDGRELQRAGLARLGMLAVPEQRHPPGGPIGASEGSADAGPGEFHPWVATIQWQPLFLEGQSVVGSVRIAPEPSPLTATLLVPVGGRQGEPGALLAGVLNLPFLWDRIAGGLVGRSGSAFLVVPDGRLLARAGRAERSPLETALQEPAVAAALRGGTASDRAWVDGAESFRAHVPIPELGWAVVVWLPVGEALEPLGEMREIMAERREELAGKIRRRGDGQVLALRQEIGQAVEAEAAAGGAQLERTRRTHLDAFNAVLPVDLADSASAFSTRFRWTLAVAIAILVLLSVLAGALLAGRIGGRVARLATGAEGLGAGDLAARVPVESADELGTLAARFNAMAAALEVREREARAQARAMADRGRELERLNAELRDASRVKSEFLANTSHELRTPLNAILGFIKLIRDGLYDSPEEHAQYLKDAHDSALHLLGLINNVLDLAKIEAREMNLALGPVELERAFDEARALTHIQARERGIGLEFLTPRESPLVRADAAKLKQVLVNLIGNALKFTSEGHIRITALPHLDRGYVAIAVADTGIGIPREKQPQLFQPFRQADGSTTRRFGGTGLGLAICRALVELMGGTIRLESPGEGQGTTVTFTLPLADEGSALPVAPPGVEPRDAARPLILVVEDDGAFGRFLYALCIKSGYQCVMVGTAEAGLEAALRLRPAAITVDAALPAAAGARLHSGWDLIRALQGDPATRRIPVLMLTGHAGSRPGPAPAGESPGPEVWLKPVDPDALLARLAELTRVEGRPMRVLVADDDPSLRTFLHKLLPSDRYEVTEAVTGKETLGYLSRPEGANCDILLLDLMMPEGSGYDVLRGLHGLGGRHQPQVLVLTNWPDPRTEEERLLLQSAPVLAVLEKSTILENPQALLRQLADICHPDDRLPAGEEVALVALGAHASRGEVG